MQTSRRLPYWAFVTDWEEKGPIGAVKRKMFVLF